MSSLNTTNCNILNFLLLSRDAASEGTVVSHNAIHASLTILNYRKLQEIRVVESCIIFFGIIQLSNLAKSRGCEREVENPQKPRKASASHASSTSTDYTSKIIDSVYVPYVHVRPARCL